MSISDLLKKAAVRIEQKNDSLFRYPVAKQKTYLASFPEPADCIQRSRFQYRCQMKLNGWAYRFFANIASLPLILLYLAKWTKQPVRQEEQDAVFFPDGKPENIVPDELRKQYSSWAAVENKEGFLSKEDRRYFRKIAAKYPLSWLFLLKCLMKIGFYSNEIEKYSPKAVVVCNEYSYTSSLLTDYCRSRGIRHIDVMHGEKLYSMQDSFFQYDECYVWGNEYRDLFLQLNAEEKQFHIAVPGSLLFVNRGRVEKKIDYTYYLGAETGEALDRILNSMQLLRNRGSRVAIRPHPRYSDLNEIKRKIHDIEIEDCGTLKIEDSVLRTENAVSLFSTVLNQAIHNGTGVVIDDITNPEFYGKLQELQYAILQSEHKLLSEIIGDHDQ